MKKHLIAAAVAAAVAVPAMAQNVSISGRLDLGYTDKNLKGSSAGTEVKSKTITSSPFTTSYIRLNGTEDLGGGLKANFFVETNATNAPSSIGDRGLWAELSGGFGALRAGTQNSVTRDVWTGFAQTGAINIVGDLNSSTAEDAGGQAGVEGFETSIRYFTPNISGFVASVAVNSATVDTDGAKSGSNGNAFSLRYDGGPFSAMAAYSKKTVDTPAVTGVNGTFAQRLTATGALSGFVNQATAPVAAAASTVVTITAPIVGAAAYETDTKITAVAASYDLGAAKVALTYVDRDDKRNNTATTGRIDRKTTTLSAAAPIGSFVVFGAYGTGDQETAGNGYKGDLDAYQLGLRYNLSKRTYGYAAMGKVEHETSATAKRDYKESAVGIVHLF